MKTTHTLTGGMTVLATLLVVALIVTSCNEEDPFVDRTVAPVLLVFDGVPGYLAGGGLTSVPTTVKTVTPANVNDPVLLSVSVYQLDKSGILDHTVGIDSLPVSGLALSFSKRDGTLVIPVTSDASGKATVTTTWADLGIANAPELAMEKNEVNIGLAWSGEYNGQAFVRYSQVQFKVD